MASRRSRWLLPGLSLLLLAAIAVAVVASLHSRSHGSSPASGPSAGSQSAGAGGFDGAPLPGAPPAPPFTLTDLDGRPVSLAGYRGELVAVAFLYSACGACTLVAQQLRGALDELARPPATLIVSVYPATDTRSRVERFLGDVSLTGRVRYLVGPPRELERVWREYGVRTPAAGRSAFEAAVTVLLIDRRGRQRVIFQPEQLTPEGLAHDIRALERD